MNISNCPVGLDIFDNYCYTVISSTYPFSCPYHDPVPFGGSLLEMDSLISAKRNIQYGYYEITERNYEYGSLIDSVVPGTSGDCVLYRSTGEYELIDCSVKSPVICAYSPLDTRFCESHFAICNSTYYCVAEETQKHFCQLTSTPLKPTYNCSWCLDVYKNYSEPVITLKYNNKNTIVIEVEHSNKMVFGNEGPLFYCFSDIYQINSTEIKYRYAKEELVYDTYDYDVKIYKIRTRGRGHYWCEGFSYPNLKKITSNKVVAGKSKNDIYLLNVTILMSMGFTFVPYNLHTITTGIVEEIFFDSGIEIQSPRLLPLSEDGKSATLVFQLTITDARINYANQRESDIDKLTKYVDKLNELEEIDEIALGHSEICLPLTSLDNNQQVYWPSISLGEITESTPRLFDEDGKPIVRKCEGNVEFGSSWSPILYLVNPVDEDSEVTQDLYALLISDEKTEEINMGLKNILAKYRKFSPYDVYLVGRILERVAHEDDFFTMENFVGNVDTVARFNGEILYAAQMELNATDNILYNLDLALSKSLKMNAQDVVIITHTVLGAFVTDIRKTNTRGVAAYKYGNDVIFKPLGADYKIISLDRTNLLSAIFIPPKLYTRLIKELNEEGTEDVVLTVAVFKTNALFVDPRNITSSRAVVSVHISQYSIVGSEERVSIMFPLTTEMEVNCIHWMYGKDDLMVSIHGEWGTDTRVRYDEYLMACNYTHMTHFSAIVNAPHNRALNIISAIGCTLSIAGTTSTIVITMLFDNWRERPGTKVLLNFSLSVLLQMILMFTSNLVNGDEKNPFCLLTAILLHYVIISQFLWMFVISYLQYRKYVTFSSNEPRRLTLHSNLFGWVLPVIPVLVVSLVSRENYTNEYYCYLSGAALYFALFLPVSLIIFANLFFFGLILFKIFYKRTKAFGQKENLTLQKIRLCFALFFLMGFTWIFGLLAGTFNSMILSYLFCITSTVKGVCIFIFFVVYNKKTKQRMAKGLKINKEKLTSKRRLTFSTVSKS